MIKDDGLTWIMHNTTETCHLTKNQGTLPLEALPSSPIRVEKTVYEGLNPRNPDEFSTPKTL